MSTSHCALGRLRSARCTDGKRPTSSLSPRSPEISSARGHSQRGTMRGVPPCSPRRRAMTRRRAPRQRAIIRSRSRRFRCAKSTGSSSTPAPGRPAANPRRTEADNPFARCGFSTKLTHCPRNSARIRTARGGITTMILDAMSGERSRTALRIKLVPRTRAKALGWPSRAENPAASTTICNRGRVEDFIAIMRI